MDQGKFRYQARQLMRETGKTKTVCYEIIAKSLGYKNHNEYVSEMKRKGEWDGRGSQRISKVQKMRTDIIAKR